MRLLDKLLKWDDLHVRLKAAEEAGMELAKENGDLRIENIRLKREIEWLRGNLSGWVMCDRRACPFMVVNASPEEMEIYNSRLALDSTNAWHSEDLEVTR